MRTISLGSIDHIAFARTHGVQMSGVLEYKDQLFGVAESKSGPYVSDHAYECPGWFSGALPPSQTSEGMALTAALRGKSGLAGTINLKGAELQQFMRSGADFSKAVFSTIDFDDTDFQGLDLRGAQFIDCAFNGATFTNARLQGTRFRGCHIEATVFYGVQAGQGVRSKDAARTEFRDCRLIDSTFSQKADLAGALFINCVGKSTDWESAILDRAVFADCYLSNGHFSRASLKGATFLNLNRVTPQGLGTPYDGRTNPDYKNWLPINTLKADLTDARFLNCQLSGTIFSMTVFNRTLMVQTNIDRCSFGMAHAVVKEMRVDRATQQSWGGNGFTKADPAWNAPDALQDPKLMGNLLQLVKGGTDT